MRMWTPGFEKRVFVTKRNLTYTCVPIPTWNRRKVYVYSDMRTLRVENETKKNSFSIYSQYTVPLSTSYISNYNELTTYIYCLVYI